MLCVNSLLVVHCSMLCVNSFLGAHCACFAGVPCRAQRLLCAPAGEDAPAFIPFSFRAFSEHPALTFAEARGCAVRNADQAGRACFCRTCVCSAGTVF